MPFRLLGEIQDFEGEQAVEVRELRRNHCLCDFDPRLHSAQAPVLQVEEGAAAEGLDLVLAGTPHGWGNALMVGGMLTAMASCLHSNAKFKATPQRQTQSLRVSTKGDEHFFSVQAVADRR